TLSGADSNERPRIFGELPVRTRRRRRCRETQYQRRTEMNELLKALTDFLKEATVYLGRQNGKASAVLASNTPPPASPEVIEAAIAKRKPRATKAEMAARTEPEPAAASQFDIS